MIVVGVDGSEGSARALWFAADEARVRNCRLRIVTSWQIPVQFIQALPYILTCILLAGFIGKAIGPKAGGVPYTKER